MTAPVTGLGIGRRNDWNTPPEVFTALDCWFDCDVAGPGICVPSSYVLAADSLETDWSSLGFIWMNPPFGGRNGIRPWLDKFLDHGNGIALTPDRVSAPWFQECWHRADVILFTPKTPFLLPDGRKAGNPAFGNALWAVGDRAVEGVYRAAASGFGRLCFPAQAIEAFGRDGNRLDAKHESAVPKGCAHA